MPTAFSQQVCGVYLPDKNGSGIGSLCWHNLLVSATLSSIPESIANPCPHPASPKCDIKSLYANSTKLSHLGEVPARAEGAHFPAIPAAPYFIQQFSHADN